MKRFFLLVLVTSFYVVTNGQLALGIKAGINNSKFKNFYLETRASQGLYVGGLVKLKQTKSFIFNLNYCIPVKVPPTIYD